MNDSRQKLEWNELKEIWTNSAQTRDIHIQISDLVEELKTKTSQFEKDAINSDLATLQANWSAIKKMTTQLEKDSINKDLARITRWLRKFLKKSGH